MELIIFGGLAVCIVVSLGLAIYNALKGTKSISDRY